MKDKLLLAMKGAAMGVAEVIPGVSGGTIAFITGIYEKLINTIKSFSPALLKDFKEGGISSVWEKVNGNFLTFLLGGMAVGMVIGILGVSHLLTTVPEILWAFFFGLIIASAIYIAKQVGKWSPVEIIALVIGAIIAYGITTISPAEGNEALWFVFISGVIAISALILPGISGSFILLLMGMYTYIIPTVKAAIFKLDTSAMLVAGVFAIGCIVGLATFSRVLSWTFKHYEKPTLALLTGFMIGSLNKIWPWREITMYMNKETGERIAGSCDRTDDNFKIISESNVSPFDYTELTTYPDHFALAIVAAIAGFGVVFLLEKLGNHDA